LSDDHVTPSAGPAPRPGSSWQRSQASWKWVRRPASEVQAAQEPHLVAVGGGVEVAAQELRRIVVAATAPRIVSSIAIICAARAAPSSSR
jgi:hypothetical protein